MNLYISSRTPEGNPNRCPFCGADVRIESSPPTNDAPCPHCGTLLWFNGQNSNGMHRFVVRNSRILMQIVSVCGLAAVITIAACLLGQCGRMIGLGPTELFILLVLGLLLFGRSLPALGRKLGLSLGEANNARVDCDVRRRRCL